jgi:hypothetical protein
MNPFISQCGLKTPEVEFTNLCETKNYSLISNLDFLQFTIQSCDCSKSTTQKYDPEILTES